MSKLNDALDKINPGHVLDIGANVGDWAKESQDRWPAATLTLVEANPGCKPYLEALPFEHHIALLGSGPEPAVKFHTIGDCDTGASVYREIGTDYYKDSVGVDMEQTTLDRLFKEDRFDFIKIDTQGSELDIMRGGLDLLKSAQWVQVEVSTVAYNDGSPLAPQVVEFMLMQGFSTWRPVAAYPAIHQYDILFTRDGAAE